MLILHIFLASAERTQSLAILILREEDVSTMGSDIEYLAKLEHNRWSSRGLLIF